MKKKRIRIVILFVLGILLIFSTINIITWFHENQSVTEIVEEEKIRLKIEEETTTLEEEIKEDNQYTIGWLIVEGTNINYPVVQHTDNEFYLNHDFNNQKNSAGWIFMDYQNELTDQNLVIYGHHRRDGSMFGSIDNLFNSKDVEISFITTEETINYKVFSIYKTSKEDDYTTKNFHDFQKKVKELEEKSEINFHQDLSTTTQIITLSTCHDNNIDRIVVHGYKN